MMFDWFHQYSKIEQKLTLILERLDTMTATLKDLDAAIAAEAALEDTLVGAIKQLAADYSTLVEQAAAGTDVKAELDAVNANAAKITDAITAVSTADPKATGTPSA